MGMLKYCEINSFSLCDFLKFMMFYFQVKEFSRVEVMEFREFGTQMSDVL